MPDPPTNSSSGASNSTQEEGAGLALNVALTTSFGTLELVIFSRVNPGDPFRLVASASDPTVVNTAYVPPTDVPGAAEVVILVGTSTGEATYRIVVEAIAPRLPLRENDQIQLAAVHTACCADGGCSPAFTAVATGAADACSGETGSEWGCDFVGALTTARFISVNLTCDVYSFARPLSFASELTLLDVHDNAGLTGDVNIVLRQLHRPRLLSTLALTEVPGLSGSLPSACPDNDVLAGLSVFYISGAPNVRGSVPGCLLQNAHSLLIFETSVGGALSALPAGSKLSELTLVGQTGDAAAPRVGGVDPDFSGASALTSLTLLATAFSGTLRAGAKLDTLQSLGNAFTELDLADPSQLYVCIVLGGRLSGTVPKSLLSAPKLRVLDLSGNEYVELPEGWDAPYLVELSLADNRLEGELGGDAARQPLLTVLDLSGNALEGPLGPFAASVPEDGSSYLLALSLARNRLFGPIDGLAQLGVFTFRGARTRSGETLPNVLDLSDNEFDGPVPAEYLQGSAGGTVVLINITDNAGMRCPAVGAYATSVVVQCGGDTKSRGGGGEVGTGAVAGIVFGVFVFVGLAVAGIAALSHRRRRAAAGGYADSYVAASNTTAGFTNGGAMPTPYDTYATAADPRGAGTAEVQMQPQ